MKREKICFINDNSVNKSNVQKFLKSKRVSHSYDKASSITRLPPSPWEPDVWCILFACFINMSAVSLCHTSSTLGIVEVCLSSATSKENPFLLRPNFRRLSLHMKKRQIQTNSYATVRGNG